MINQIDSDEFKLTEKEIYITSKDGKSTLRSFRNNSLLMNLADLMEIDNLSGSEKALENFVLDKLSVALASVKITTQENINKFDPIGIDGFKANSNNRECVGFAIDNILIGNTATFLTGGILINPLWNFTVGLPVYLNGSSLSHIEPSTGFVQKVGLAKHANILFLKISEPIYKS